MKRARWLTIAALVIGALVTGYTGNPVAGKGASMAVETVGGAVLEQVDD